MNETSVQYGKQWAKKIESKVTSRMQQDTVPYTETLWPIPRHRDPYRDTLPYIEIQKHSLRFIKNIAQQIWIQFAVSYMYKKWNIIKL